MKMTWKEKFEAMTPEEQQAFKDKEAQRKRELRAKKKAESESAVNPSAITAPDVTPEKLKNEPPPLAPSFPAVRNVPPGMKLNPALYIETKSRRVNLMMQPGVADKLKELAARRGVSVNELMHALAEDLITREGL